MVRNKERNYRNVLIAKHVEMPWLWSDKEEWKEDECVISSFSELCLGLKLFDNTYNFFVRLVYDGHDFSFPGDSLCRDLYFKNIDDLKGQLPTKGWKNPINLNMFLEAIENEINRMNVKDGIVCAQCIL